MLKGTPHTKTQWLRCNANC